MHHHQYYQREMHYNHAYLWKPWYHSTIYMGYSLPVTNSVNRRKRWTTWCTWTASKFCQKRKRIGNPNTYYEDLKSTYRNGIWHRKMHQARDENWQTTHDRRSRTPKSSSKQDARRKGNLQILGHLGSWHHCIPEMTICVKKRGRKRTC